MVSTFYMICFLIATWNAIYLAQKKYKTTDSYLWTILLFIPIVILGYWIKSTVYTAEAAMVAFCFIYLDSTVLPVVLLFSLMKSLGHEPHRWVKLSVYAVTVLHIFSIWISRGTKLYYSGIEIERTDLGTITRMSSGPLKMSHYIFLGIFFLAYMIVLIWGFRQKKTQSKKSLIAYMTALIVIFAVYIIEILLGASFTTLPGLYVIASFVILRNYEHIQSHDLLNMIGEKQSQTSQRGYCAFDMNRCLLGYNEQLAELLPDIKNVIVDECIPAENEALADVIYNAIDAFDERGNVSQKTEINDRTYLFIVSDFSITSSNKQNGYLLEVSDITDEQQKIDTIEKYNERLSIEVENKTEHILEIQNSVVLGLANMVENRDDNTGGHVKRTSDVVKLLVEEIQRLGMYDMNYQNAADIVRAAPMHDLGKISIDSNLLCKPGRLTASEYEIMKTHAPKSGEIVRIILEGVEEQHFVDIAFNIARYHHERWDGKGYPDQLMGESIPLEARIMAVADVYDALVSKRCYKEPMSFADAARIMNENMGSQFDPSMRPIFAACREKLENYYQQSL